MVAGSVFHSAGQWAADTFVEHVPQHCHLTDMDVNIDYSSIGVASGYRLLFPRRLNHVGCSIFAIFCESFCTVYTSFN